MYIKDICHNCKGSGRIPFSDTEDKECPNCPDGYLRKEIECPEIAEVLDKCNDILDKCKDIFEKVNE
jgi:hypothetical protein